MSTRANAFPQLTTSYFFARYRNAYLAGAVVLAATNALALGLPYLVKTAIDQIQLRATFSDLKLCAIYIFIFALGYTFLRILSRVILFTAGRDVEGEIRQVLYEKLQSLDAAYFDQIPNGEFVSLLTNDTNVVRLLFGMGFLNLANGIILYTMAASLVFYLNPYMGLWSIFPYLFMVLLLRWVAPRFHKQSHEVQEKVADLTVFIQENISGHEVIRNHACEAVQDSRFERINRKYFTANMKLTAVRGILFTSTGAIGGMGTLLVLAIGGRLVIENQIGLGDLVAFFGYLALLTMPTLMLGFVISIWQRSRASMERMNAFLALQSLTQFPEIQAYQDKMGSQSKLEIEELAVKHLSFTYPTIGFSMPFRSHQSQPVLRSRDAVLKNISVEFIPRQMNAIVGEVGCGKTTLVNLLMKRYPVAGGSIVLNGRDINDFAKDDLTRLFSYVPQEPFLFSLTLAKNIAFGLPDDSLSDLDYLKVQELSGATLLGLAEGELSLTPETKAGERGARLSGGQRQRVTLARALAKGAPVLILDEPFSHLDSDTADKMMEMLKERGCTIIVVTHKISLIKDAKQIIVLKDGEVEQIGSHRQLIKSSKTYRGLLALEELEHADA